MKISGFVLAFLAVLAMSAVALSTPARFSIEDQDFRLWDTQGHAQTLSYYSDRRAIVLLAWPGNCASREKILNWYGNLQSQLKIAKAAVFWLNSSKERMASSDAPVLIDGSQSITRSLGFRAAGDYLILDPVNWTRVASGSWSDGGVERWLGRSAVKSNTGAAICPLSLEDHSDITWSSSLAKKFFRNCVACHMEHKSINFFKKDEDVFNWSAMSRLTVRLQTMPPNPNDPGIPNCVSDIGFTLQPDELNELQNWLEAGAPHASQKTDFISDLYREALEAKAREAKASGRPLMTWEMPAADSVPVAGPDLYRMVQVAGPLKQDVRISSYAFARHSAARHHIQIYALPKPLNEYPDFSDKLGDDLGKFINKITPYRLPIARSGGHVFLAQSEIFVPKGSYIAFQIHYHPIGRLEKNREAISIYSDPAMSNRPDRKSLTQFADSETIPAGARDFVARTELVLPEDMTITDTHSHSHARGKAFTLSMTPPGGKAEVICRLSKYNLTSNSEFTRPIFVRKGTRLTFEYVFDNSAQNPINPDPSQDVAIGLSYSNEMMTNTISYVSGKLR